MSRKQRQQKNFTYQDFLDAYNALCNRMGWRVSARPTLIPDVGGWKIGIQFQIEKTEATEDEKPKPPEEEKSHDSPL